MNDTVEKNDVDISKIFNWGRVFEIVDEDESNPVLVYMKLLGDADLGRARVYALRKSSELRRKLRDENSDERIAWVRTEEELKTEDLVNLILLFSGRELANSAKNTIKLQAPKPPKSTANLEKMEKFQKEVDEFPAKRAKAVSEAIAKEVEKLRDTLSKKSKDELYREYVKTVIDEFCEREAFTAFEDMQTYLGCFKDDTYSAESRFFKDFEEFNNLEPTVKAQFRDAYRTLDIDISELKKLRRATP